MATKIIFVRHGQTAWNLEGRCQGHTDIPLDDTGLAQARALAAALADTRIDAIYASDLARAHQTATLVATQRALAVRAHAGLREMHMGTWQGKTDDEIERLFPGADAHDEGETSEQVRARVVAAIVEIASRHRGEHVLVVSHGRSLELFRAHVGQPDTPLGNCEWFALVVDDDGAWWKA